MKNIYHIDKKITKNDEITDRTWISIEEPTAEDKKFLLEDLKIPAAFYNDIEDIDERPRIEVEDDWTFVYSEFRTKLPTKNLLLLPFLLVLFTTKIIL